MRFASLGSGSEGNGLVVEASAAAGRERPTRVLVDCGFGIRESEARLGRLGIEPFELDAILVTHEHGDHIGGVFALARRHRIPVWATHGTLASVLSERFAEVAVHVCSSDVRFAIHGLDVQPFPVPHDAREPVQFVFDDGTHRLGVLTDIGRSTAHIVESLAGCDGLFMECNHDAAMLEASAYPYSLKQRIRGDYGHLSNDVAREIVARLDRSRLTRLVAAHLSQANNTPDLARAAMAEATGWPTERIDVADQSTGAGWFDLGRDRPP